MNDLKVVLTDDKDLLCMIDNLLKKRNGICPCAVLSTNPSKEEIKKYTCMCEPFRKQTTEGSCHCGKYIKKFIEKN